MIKQMCQKSDRVHTAPPAEKSPIKTDSYTYRLSHLGIPLRPAHYSVFTGGSDCFHFRVLRFKPRLTIGLKKNRTPYFRY
ncbi:hypothetical protein XELAEV_18028432mg [Xenopus laevis]|uniref:Uncharacterized protein n=1 Tax=Xenopus laevis TaxID=8355 RepID=A0A974CXE9_XENLA|nr:hypothetical protein XELAEV_18028432mg [Xenopus laevis]